MEIDALASAEAPSLLGAGLRLLLFALLFAGAVGGWWWWRRRQREGGRQLEILDRALLSRGASVALLRVADRTLLIGVSPEGVRLLKSFGRAEPFADTLESVEALEEGAP